MGIGAFITGLLCNHLTNTKWGDSGRDVQLYNRYFYPLNDFSQVVTAPPEVTNTTKCQQQQESVLQD